MVSAIPLLAASIALVAAPTNAFTYSFLAHNKYVDVSGGVSVVGPLHAIEDASAQALSDYMAKSHEDKLKAVKAVEESKNIEIEALKAEIRQLKSGAPAVVAPVANDAVSSSALSKLASYQAFMTEYIVDAQNQKLLAVKEAESKAEKKFEERLEQLSKTSGPELPLPKGVANAEGGGAGHAAASSVVAQEKPLVVAETPVAVAVQKKPVAAAAVSSAPPTTSSSPSLRDLANLAGASSFHSRNAYIIRAGAAGKSRWGTKEIQKAQEDLRRATPPAVSAAQEAAVPASPYEHRNGQVIAAAGAGKSRWGTMEVERSKKKGVVTETAAVAQDAETGVEATSEDRVNLGARLLEGAQKFMNGGQ